MTTPAMLNGLVPRVYPPAVLAEMAGEPLRLTVLDVAEGWCVGVASPTRPWHEDAPWWGFRVFTRAELALPHCELADLLDRHLRDVVGNYRAHLAWALTGGTFPG